MRVVFGVVLALFCLLLGCWVLVASHPSSEDREVQCLRQDLLHPKCLVVTASFFDMGAEFEDLVPPAVIPFQFS